jgi:hypothetical protein
MLKNGTSPKKEKRTKIEQRDRKETREGKRGRQLSKDGKPAA